MPYANLKYGAEHISFFNIGLYRFVDHLGYTVVIIQSHNIGGHLGSRKYRPRKQICFSTDFHFKYLNLSEKKQLFPEIALLLRIPLDQMERRQAKHSQSVTYSTRDCYIVCHCKQSVLQSTTIGLVNIFLPKITQFTILYSVYRHMISTTHFIRVINPKSKLVTLLHLDHIRLSDSHPCEWGPRSPNISSEIRM